MVVVREEGLEGAEMMVWLLNYLGERGGRPEISTSSSGWPSRRCWTDRWSTTLTHKTPRAAPERIIILYEDFALFPVQLEGGGGGGVGGGVDDLEV